MITTNNSTVILYLKQTKTVMFLLVVLLCSTAGFSQSNILNAKDPSEIGKKTEEQIANDNNQFLQHGFIDDRDILWSKIIYEKIDLSERINFPLLYPTNDALYKDERKSLWRIIKEAILQDSISNVYDPSNDNFTTKISIDSVKSQINSKEVVNGQVAFKQLESADIRSYDIKGIWYFDKRMGEMKYRLLGIRPVGKDINASADPDLSEEEQELNEENIANTPLFWIWYPDLRPILHREKVFNERNNALRITFDQLLTARRFNAYIYKVDNVHEDRTISTYLPKDPFLQMLESNRIKEEIRNFEQDMWNY